MWVRFPPLLPILLSAALGEMDIISVFETEGGSSILSGPAILQTMIRAGVIPLEALCSDAASSMDQLYR